MSSLAYEAMARSVQNLPPGSVNRIENGEKIEPFSTEFVEHIRDAVLARDKIQEGIDRVAEAERKNAPRLLAEIEEVRKKKSNGEI